MEYPTKIPLYIQCHMNFYERKIFIWIYELLCIMHINWQMQMQRHNSYTFIRFRDNYASCIKCIKIELSPSPMAHHMQFPCLSFFFFFFFFFASRSILNPFEKGQFENP